MKETSKVQFLTSFFLLLKASIEEYKIFDNKISGIVGWDNEDDKQAFVGHLEMKKYFLGSCERSKNGDKFEKE